MIALGADCLVFTMATGESIPFSAEMISIEVLGETADGFDSEFVQQASKAVFHYFKHELELQSVSVGEYAKALEKVLRGFALAQSSIGPIIPLAQPLPAEPMQPAAARVLRSDLGVLVEQSGEGCELFFFPKLRDEIRSHLSQSPKLVHFRGLRGCVKQLAGAQRWSARCQCLQDQIVDYLRTCFTVEAGRGECALVVQ